MRAFVDTSPAFTAPPSCTGSCNENQGRGRCNCVPDVELEPPQKYKYESELATFVLAVVLVVACGVLFWVIPMGPAS